MGGSGIDWPAGPYELPRHTGPLLVAWLCALTLIGVAVAIVAIPSTVGQGRQDLADAAAALGFGQTIEQARVTAVECSRFQRKADVYHYCDVTITGPQMRHEYEITVDTPPQPADAGRVARVGDRLASRGTAK